MTLWTGFFQHDGFRCNLNTLLEKLQQETYEFTH